MTRTALLFSIVFVTWIPSDAGATSVPASFLGPAAAGPECAPLTWQSLYPWSHCHEWDHQVYGDGWGLPYFSIGFAGSGFAPIFPSGAYWGLDVRFLPVGWGHAHGPHLAGTRCAYRGDCLGREARPPAKSFTIERPPTRTADDGGAASSPAPALLFQSGAQSGGEGMAVSARRSKVVTLAPTTSRRLNSAQRARPPSTTLHRVHSASGASSLTGAQSRSRIRAIDQAVNQWRSRNSGRRTSVFGARSTRRGDYPNRGGVGSSASVRSKGTRGSSGARPTRGRKGTGEKGVTKVRTGGGGV